MKSKYCALILIGILAVVPLCFAQTENSNTSIEEVKKETQDLLKTIGSYTADKKEEALEKTKEGLIKLDKRINALEKSVDKNWDTMSKAARKKSRENLRDLRTQRNQVAEWYGSMKTSSADAWDHIKKGFSDAYKALEDAWEKSEKEFKSNGSKE
ncbi:MAG: hypothetical protein WGN25_07515 [Candidatus Electrothrix sp. GW3-4]|uniref:hypothetical protein n=1 Tax=Candidatus Electrothrix sp. GW3-4 TaxID=3126740 RepID=UPI0030D23908